MLTEVELFTNTISSINERDYGDFKRAAQEGFNHLRDSLHAMDDANIKKKLAEMELYLEFAPNWDVDSTIEKLAQDAKYIDELVQAHRQDWESATDLF